MCNQPYTLEALRAVLQAADDKLCFGHTEEDADQATWLVTAASILVDAAIEQRRAKRAKQEGQKS